MGECKGLAQRLRPKLFKELLGQELTAEALSTAVSSGRLAQAFLFSGPRGVGKTSAARILARALLCEHRGEGGEPCNNCDICESILRNACVDVQEMDAASNRGIDSIRELRKNAKYVPSRASRKVYIMDEVHMLTMESFNALLKILEEPPPHVTFIFATTESQKIPSTVLSRCQRFQFARLSGEQIAKHLGEVARQEGAELSERSLSALSQHAHGSMRDALMGLDQIWAFAGKKAQAGKILEMLGLLEANAVWQVLEAVLEQQPAKALVALDEVYQQGGSLGTLLGQLIEEVSGLSMLLALQSNSPELKNNSEILSAARISVEARDFLARAELSTDVLQQLFYVLLEAEQHMRQSRFEKMCLEMAILKGCQLKSLAGIGFLLEEARHAVQSDKIERDKIEHGKIERDATEQGTAGQNNTHDKLPSVSNTENSPKPTNQPPAQTVEQAEPQQASSAETSNPVLTDPVLTDPVLTDPVLTDPVLTDPVLTDPVLTDPVLTDPVLTTPPVQPSPYTPHNTAPTKANNPSYTPAELETLQHPAVQQIKNSFPSHEILKVKLKKPPNLPTPLTPHISSPPDPA